MKVSKNMKVDVSYKLYIDNFIVDESKDSPFSFIFGYSQVIPGFEKNLLGMSINEQKNFFVQPEDGYGVVRDELFEKIPVSHFPPNSNIQVGQVFQVSDQNGNPMQFTVEKIENEEILANFNHPLSGKILNFDVTVKNIQPAGEKELSMLLNASNCSSGCGSCCSDCH